MATLSGLALPATRTSGGYFATKTGVDVAWGDLLNAIMCPIGGRVMNRSFGSGVPTALFDPGDQFLLKAVERLVRSAAANFAPHVKIVNVQVKVDAMNLSITIAFAYGGDIATRVARIDRHSTIQYISARSR